MCMNQAGYYILSLLLLSLKKLHADETITKCFEGSEVEPFGNVTFSCPPGETIRVAEAIIGRNPWMKCLLTEDDCTHPTKIFESCEGQTDCSRRFKTYSPRCGYITILLLSYTCTQSTADAPTKSTPPLRSLVDGSPDQPTVHKPSTSVDQSDPSTYHPPPKPKSEPDDSSSSDKETGLVVATIFASILTVFMLIVAIIMTIRRLLDYPARNRRANGGSASRLTMCLEGACGHVDKLPCFPSPGDLSGQESLRSRKSISPGWREDTVQTSHETRRVAPIGQESSDQTTHPSREQDQDEMDAPDNMECDHVINNGSPSTRDLVENVRRDRNTFHPTNMRRIIENTQPNHQRHQRRGKKYQADDDDKNIPNQPYDANINNNKSYDININNNNIIIDKPGIKRMDGSLLSTEIIGRTDPISFPTSSSDNSTISLSKPSTHSRDRTLPQGNEFTGQNCVPSFDVVVVSNLETSSKC